MLLSWKFVSSQTNYEYLINYEKRGKEDQPCPKGLGSHPQ